jgi:hypothetical protein
MEVDVAGVGFRFSRLRFLEPDQIEKEKNA